MSTADIHAYRIFARGTGLKLPNKTCSVGFYATVFVTARNAQAAEATALNHLKERLTTKDAITERTELTVESIDEIDPEEIPPVQPGLTFYRE